MNGLDQEDFDDDEIRKLIETLHEDIQRLEKLTKGQVDAVADRHGRTFLLRDAQDSLRRAEAAKQATILDALPTPIALLDPQGTIVSVNEAWRQFPGGDAVHRPGYQTGLNYIDICQNALGDKATVAQNIADGVRSVLTADIMRFTIDYLSKSSTGLDWFRLTVIPLEKDRPNGAVVVHLNITEQKRLERLKDEFVATVSHELRTPLTSITASLGLLVGKTFDLLPPRAARLLEIAHTNSHRLVRLVNDILDMEKLGSGQVVFELSRVEVLPLIKRVVEATKEYADDHRVGIRVECASSLPAYVRADSDRLAQVVANLLSNAVRFSPSDGEVVVSITSGNELIRLSVEDHGSGISADFASRVFDRFAQADASNARKKGGSGLGLSIVKQIVDRLHGEIRFSDAPGGGTIFDVELPSWASKCDAANVKRDESAVDLVSSSEAEFVQAAPVSLEKEAV